MKTYIVIESLMKIKVYEIRILNFLNKYYKSFLIKIDNVIIIFFVQFIVLSLNIVFSVRDI